MKRMTSMLVLGALGWRAAPARAQPAGAQAEVLFREARDLMAQGKYLEACPMFEHAQKLDPTAGTLLNLASCREKAGQLATAWSVFLEVERQLRGAADANGKSLHDVAQARAAAIEPRISHLTLAVAEAAKVPGLEVRRDAELVDPIVWNRAIPIDGGTYTIRATAPGRQAWTTTVTIANEADQPVIAVPKLDPPVAAAPQVPARVASDRPGGVGALGERTTPPSRAMVGSATAATFAVLGAGLAFDLLGDRAAKDGHADGARSNHRIAAALGVIGLVGAGISTYLYVERHRIVLQLDASATTTTATVSARF